MTRFRLSLLVLAILMVAFGASLIASIPMLPNRVATHFDAAGVPNGWMSRTEHLIAMTALGFGLPLFIVGMCWTARYLPMSAINIPHRDYWLAADRREETVKYMFHQSIWLACLETGFMMGLHWAVAFSNLRQPVGLPVAWILSLTGAFLIGLIAWIVCLYRRFHRPDTGPANPIATIV